MTHRSNRFSVLAAALVLAGCAGMPITVDPGAEAVRPFADAQPQGEAAGAAKVHVDLGEAYFQVGRYDVALDEARNALTALPGYPPAHHLMGLIYMFIGDAGNADANFRRALSSVPGEPQFSNSYGWFLCTQGRYDEGLALLAQAARNPYYKTPTRPHANAGLCELRRNNDEAAAEHFRRALRADPGNAQATFQLASIAYRAAQYLDARTHLVRLHQTSDPTPESAWLGLLTERRLGNANAEASYAAQLRSRFSASPEYQKLLRGQFE